MKKLLVIAALPIVVCLAGCTTEADIPSDNMISAQKAYLSQMGFAWPEDNDEIFRLATFPNSSYDGPNYRLTIKAIVADYNFKYLLVAINPLSEQAKKTFADFRELPNLHVINNLSNGSGSCGSSSGTADEKMFVLRQEAIGSEAYLYLPSELPKDIFESHQPFNVQLIKNYAVAVDLSSVISAPLKFDCSTATEHNGCTLQQLSLCATTLEAVFTVSLDLQKNGEEAVSAAVEAQSITLTDNDNNQNKLPLDGSAGYLSTNYDDEAATYTVFSTIPVLNLEDIGNLQINGHKLEKIK